MGTRGTLRIYLNGELKVRQYNQWDSYPTGQFSTICRHMSDKHTVYNLTRKLVKSNLATKDKMKEVCNKSPSEQSLSDSWMCALSDRDIGADLIPILANAPMSCDSLPDWLYLANEENDELLMEEGNYEIYIECKCKHEMYISSPEPDSIRFRLAGEYHGKEREFEWNYIPTDEEIKSWEQEDSE